MVQRRSARFVLNKKDRYASVTKMMESLGWPSLQKRRTNAKLIMFYKIINDIVDVDTDDNILVPVTCHYTRGHLMQPYTRVDAYKFHICHHRLNFGIPYQEMLSIKTQ